MSYLTRRANLMIRASSAKPAPTPKRMGPKIHLRFGGGAEVLFDNIKEWEIELPPLKEFIPGCERVFWTMKDFIFWIKENILRERPKLFMQNDTVRPGILVLINDEDWELFGELRYEICVNDTITFLSTLHGG